MITALLQQFGAAASCTGGDFLGFPKWYKYLPGTTDPNSHICAPQLTGLNDIWLILAAVLEIMLRIAVLLAVGMIIYGGFNYITSQGEPDKTSKARGTIINALVGLLISIMATALIAFLAGAFK